MLLMRTPLANDACHCWGETYSPSFGGSRLVVKKCSVGVGGLGLMSAKVVPTRKLSIKTVPAVLPLNASCRKAYEVMFIAVEISPIRLGSDSSTGFSHSVARPVAG